MFPLPICDNENAGNTYYRKSLHMKCALKDSTKGGTSDTFEHIQPKMVLNQKQDSVVGRNIFKRFILLNLIFVHKKYDTKYLYMCICMFMYFVLGCTSESITHVVIYC